MKKTLAAMIIALAFSLIGPLPESGEAEVRQIDSILRIDNQHYTISYHLDRGEWDLLDPGDNIIIKKASARAVLVPAEGRREKVLTSARAGECSWQNRETSDRLGAGVEVTVACTLAGGPRLSTMFRSYPSLRIFTVRAAVEDFPGKPGKWRVKSLQPLWSPASKGGLFLGNDPSHYKILENGSNLYLDFIINLFEAGSPAPMPARLFPGKSRSDFMGLVFDPGTGKSVLSGFLGGEEMGLVIADYSRARPGRDHGREGMSGYGATWNYRPPMPAKGRFESAPLYIDPSAPDPFQALEDYGRALARWLDHEVWPGPVPTGWNSWGEYYSDIDEDIILANLEFAADRLRDYGMRYFQIDSGYSPYWGDWEADPVRFPHGMKWVADRISEKGMVPGIWIAPADADVRSQTFRDHPEWFLQDRGLKGKLLVGDENMQVLDFSNPEVKRYLREIVRKYTREWGYKWLKVDFAYHFLMFDHAGDPGATVPAHYREAMRIIQEEAGPDVFVLGIGVCGINHGLVDGQRLSLDNMPAWNNKKSLFTWSPPGFVQGLVPTVRVAARRYWMNRTLWINHPDLIYFDNDRWPEWGDSPITYNQALCFASMVGLSGGIVKIGDRLMDMTDQEVETVQKLLPVYKGSARPLDLFGKETPEVWDLKVATVFGGWDVVGLFNWGENWENGKHVPAAARDFRLEWEDLGIDPETWCLAFDFWNEKFLGRFQGGVSVRGEPETVRVLKIVTDPGHPWFLSSNRHITQGGIEVKSVEWDRKRRILGGGQEAVPGHRYHLFFYCPPGYAPLSARINGREVAIERDGDVLVLDHVSRSDRMSWRIYFQSVGPRP